MDIFQEEKRGLQYWCIMRMIKGESVSAFEHFCPFIKTDYWFNWAKGSG